MPHYQKLKETFLRAVFVTLGVLFCVKAGWSFSARLYLFLNLPKDFEGEHLLKRASVSEGSKVYEVLLESTRIRPSPFGQTYLGFVEVPKGSYEKTVFEFEGGTYEVYLGGLKVRDAEEKLLLFELKREEGKTKLGFKPSTKPIPTKNLFALTRQGTAWVIRGDLKRVVYLFKVCEGVEDADLYGERLYVLCGRKRVVEVVGTSLFRVEDVVPVGSAGEPEYIASGGRYFLVVVPRERTIFAFDAFSGSLVNSKRFNFSLGRIRFFHGSYFVLAPVEGAVYRLDERLEERLVLNGVDPVDVAFDGDYVYVLERGGGLVLVRASDGRYLGRTEVCEEPERTEVVEEVVLVSCGEGKVVAFFKGHLGAFAEFEVERGISAITADVMEGWAYVAAKGGVFVLDLSSQKTLGEIRLGGDPVEVVFVR